jgi:hypothetical protein
MTNAVARLSRALRTRHLTPQPSTRSDGQGGGRALDRVGQGSSSATNQDRAIPARASAAADGAAPLNGSSYRPLAPNLFHRRSGATEMQGVLAALMLARRHLPRPILPAAAAAGCFEHHLKTATAPPGRLGPAASVVGSPLPQHDRPRSEDGSPQGLMAERPRTRCGRCRRCAIRP